jgi:hypothetical protein
MRLLPFASLGLVACNAIFGIEQGLPLEGGAGGVGAGPIGGAGGDAGAAGAGAQGGAGGEGGEGGAGGGPVGPICDPLDGPIDPSCGIFVDANAEPGGDGSIGAPLQTIQEAFALAMQVETPNIYVCGSPSFDNSQLEFSNATLSIFGSLR